jgi:hypothetical protein
MASWEMKEYLFYPFYPDYEIWLCVMFGMGLVQKRSKQVLIRINLYSNKYSSTHLEDFLKLENNKS